MNHTPTIGVIAAPGWLDPTCYELERQLGSAVRTTQTILGPGDFDYSFTAIEKIKPALLHATLQLSHAGCNLIIQVGPAFAYFLGKNIAGCRALDAALSDLAGVPVITNGTAVLNELTRTDARHLMLACPYYNTEWRNWFTDFLERQGFRIAGISGFIEAGLFPDQASIDARHYGFSDKELHQCLQHAAQQAPQADTLLVSGSGVRINALARRPDIPQPQLLSADSALMQATRQTLHSLGFNIQPAG